MDETDILDAIDRFLAMEDDNVEKVNTCLWPHFHQAVIELKNGETYNGHLVSCDNWMNINLREVICTSRDGDKFWRMPECYIRGSTIKYLRWGNQHRSID